MKFKPSEEFMKVKDEVLVLPKMPSDKDRLELYALYKQTTEGDIKRPKPYLTIDQEGKKWTAWNKVKGTPREKAQERYIAKVKELQGIKPTEEGSETVNEAEEEMDEDGWEDV